MAIVTSVETVRGRVEILTDGRFSLRIPRTHFDKCPLKPGDVIDPEAYVADVAAVQSKDAYEAALTGLDRSDRTEKQISQLLARRGYVPPVIDDVIDRLKRSGLVDDARYAKRMAETRSGQAVGIYALKRSMKARGISDDDIDAAVEGLDDEQQAEAALTIARGLIRKYTGLSPRQARAKLSQALARRGFGWSAVESAAERLEEEGWPE